MIRLNDNSVWYKLTGVARFYLVKLYHWHHFQCRGVSLFGPRLQFYINKPGMVLLGNRTILSGDVMLQSNGELHIGDNFFMNAYSRIVCHDRIVIGDSVTIASGVSILDHDHKAELREGRRVMDGYITAPVSIGSNVWIGDRVVVLKGVSIGNNVVIGAGSVVSRDIPDNATAVGIPARVVGNDGQADTAG